MDLTINVEDYLLNVRAAGVIIHNNKLLVHKNEKPNHYCLIGGRVEIGEDSETALKREIKEEIGKEVYITDYISTIEDFFEFEGKKVHEIMFIHRAEFVDEDDKKIEYSLKNVEGKDYLHYEWLDLNKLENYLILPSIVKNILKGNKFPVHKIFKQY